MQEIKIEHTFIVHQDYSSFDKHQVQLFEAAKRATKDAYAPYSHFHVGAAALLSNGEIIIGNNQENAAYPSGLCAERVALFYASAKFPGKEVKALAITIDYDAVDTDEIIPPCGGCRQVIAESQAKQEQDITIYLLGRDQHVCVIDSIGQLLPLAFSREVLRTVKT